MHPAPGTDGSIMVEGTPLVLINGIEFDGDMSDPNNLFTFMVEQGVNF